MGPGTYNNAAFTMADGIDVYGGFDQSFQRDPSKINGLTTATIQGQEGYLVSGSPEAVTVVADSLSHPTTLSGLTIVGPDTQQQVGESGRSTFAILVTDTDALTIENNIIAGGIAADGLAGSDGQDAPSLTSAPGGQTGGSAAEYSTSCDESSHGGGGPAVTNSYTGGSDPGSGRGGDGGEMDTSCGWWGGCSNCFATAGDPGQNAAQWIAGGYGFGGYGGW